MGKKTDFFGLKGALLKEVQSSEVFCTKHVHKKNEQATARIECLEKTVETLVTTVKTLELLVGKLMNGKRTETEVSPTGARKKDTWGNKGRVPEVNMTLNQQQWPIV
jgi:hypothetical protein